MTKIPEQVSGPKHSACSSDRVVAGALAAAVVFASMLAQGDTPPGSVIFQKHVIDPDFSNGYQVSTADLDLDGAIDVIALSTDPSQLAWYHNPDWTRRPISTRTQRNIDCAPHDIDGDGDTDLAVASDFDLGNSQSGGTLQWLENPGDPALKQEWNLHPIGAVPTAHRVRWADVDGDEKKELINLPIIGIAAVPPDYAVGVHFGAYSVPSRPSLEAWTALLLDYTLCMAHGLCVTSPEDGAQATLLTASFDGVHRYQWNNGGMIRVQLGQGHPGPRPEQGSSEVGMGCLRSDESRFVATIEPWHGNEVVVYSGRDSDPLPWPRTVIDGSLVDGHGLVCLDVDGDGTDEIVAGGRGGTHDVLLYRWSPDGWQRNILDPGSVAIAGLTVADINGDGRPDLVATGTATHNVVWYENQAGKQ
jgi:hypothetical protein